MRYKTYISFFVFCCVSVSVMAARTINWDNTTSDQDFTNPANWLYDGQAVNSLLADDYCQIKIDGESEYPKIDVDITIGRIQCGISGASGKLDIISGNATANELSYVGHGNNSVGELNVSGGSLFVDERLMVGNLNGTGTLNLSGGAITTAYGRDIYFPFNTGIGILNMTGGSLIAGQHLVIGGGNGAGIGNVTVSGGTLSTIEAIRLGAVENAIASMKIKGDAAVTVASYITVGSSSGSNNNLIVSENATVLADRINVALNDSVGTLTVKDNSVVTTDNDLTVAKNGKVILEDYAALNINGDTYFNTGSELVLKLNCDRLNHGFSVLGEAAFDGDIDIELINSGNLAVGESYTIKLSAGDILTDLSKLDITMICDLAVYEGVPIINDVSIEDNGTNESIVITFEMSGPLSCEDLLSSGRYLVGDLSGNCYVDIEDFSILALNWLSSNAPGMSSPIYNERNLTDTWRVVPMASESVIYKVEDPDSEVLYNPMITIGSNQRIIVSFSAPGDNKIYTSDDGGESWQYRSDHSLGGARLFNADGVLHILGHISHRGDLGIVKSDDNGLTWSGTYQLTTGERWHGSSANVMQKDGYVYTVIERNDVNYMTNNWDVSEFTPILMRGDIDAGLTDAQSWTYASSMPFCNTIDDSSLDYFGVPRFGAFYPDKVMLKDGVGFPPVGWLESNIVQIIDPKNYWYDPDGKTFHIFSRAHTGRTNLATVIKAVEQPDGTIKTDLVISPSGKKMVYLPFPGGQMKFFVLYDEVSELYWLLSTQSTDCMTKAELLPPGRHGGPDNERRRLQLSFSKNMVDWCFAGIVAIGPIEKASRHYGSMAISGDDLLIVSRSGDEDAQSAHNGDIITFHKIRDFRRLIY